MGSMNFSIHGVASRITEWRYDWEKPYLEGMEDQVFRNTFKDIRYILEQLGAKVRGSSSSATMSAISTIWPTLPSRAW